MAEEPQEKPKAPRGLMASLPQHAQDEMREANRELGMALGVIRDVVDAAVAQSLPPGKVTELVLARRRKDDEGVLRRRLGLAPYHEGAGDGEDKNGDPVTAPTAQVIDLMGALKESLAKQAKS